MALKIPVFLDATEGYMEEFDSASDGMSLDSLVIGGGSEIANNINLSGGGTVQNITDPSNPQDAASKNYVDNLVDGLDYKQNVVVATTGNITLSGEQTLDGILTSTSRVLVKNQTLSENNGIYTTAAGAWTRTDDADVAADFNSGLTVWVSEGNTQADTRWTISTNDAIVVDTTPIAFAQTSGSGSIPIGTATSGGTGAVIGRLGGDSDKGIGITAGILETKIDAVTIDFNGSGQMNVTGIPSLFEVNGVATTASVSATNLNTLTNGSNADALHAHAAAAATEAPKVEGTYVANENLTAGDPVYWGANDQVAKGDAGVDTKSRAVGVSENTVSAAGNSTVISVGPAVGVISGLSPVVNDPIYLAAGGGLTKTRPSSGNRIIVMGYAKNNADLWVDIRDYGKRV